MAATSHKRRHAWIVGAVVEVPLGNGWSSCAQLLRSPRVAIFDLVFTGNERPDLTTLRAAKVLARIWVNKDVITRGEWSSFLDMPVREGLDGPQEFFIVDPISGETRVHWTDGDRCGQRSATFDECRDLQCASVADSEHVRDRLNAHFFKAARTWPVSLQEHLDRWRARQASREQTGLLQ